MKRRARHHEILSVLTNQGRLIDVPLCAHHWGTKERIAAGELEALARDGELVRRTDIMRCIQPVSACLASYRPGGPLPPPGAISSRARARWYAQPPSTRAYYLLSRAAAKSRGVRQPVIEPRKLSHDLGVTAVVLHLLRVRPTEAKNLRGEDQLAFAFSAHGLKQPDLFFIDDNATVVQSAEYVSCYSSDRVSAYLEFHRDILQPPIPTELY